MRTIGHRAAPLEPQAAYPLTDAEMEAIARRMANLARARSTPSLGLEANADRHLGEFATHVGIPRAPRSKE